MAFQQGLSGLNSSSKALDAISNNIANASTVGYKAAGVQFADVYAASLGVGGASQIGIGTSIAAVQQQFSQGNISTSNNPLDIAINGGGFFQLQKSVADETKSYSRNGQFHVDDQGYIVNAQNNNLVGYQFENGVQLDIRGPIQLAAGGVEPKATGTAALNSGVQVEVNLDDREKRSLGTLDTNKLEEWSSNKTMPPSLDTYSFSTSIALFDQRGNSHTMSMYFTRIEPSTSVVNGEDKDMWDVHYVLDDTDVTQFMKPATPEVLTAVLEGPSPIIVPTVQFDASGAIKKTWPDTTVEPPDTNVYMAPTIARGDASEPDWSTNPPGTISLPRAVDYQFSLDVTALTDPTTGHPQFANLFPNPIKIDMSNSTMFGAGYDVTKLVQDGYPFGRLSGVSVSPDGIVLGNYSNGQTKPIARLSLFDFTSPTGLASMGNNQWAETAASGQAIPGMPGVGSRGLVQSSSVEDSNVDLTQELVNMITQQRNYQANAQSIKTQDQVMQTLVNLR